MSGEWTAERLRAEHVPEHRIAETLAKLNDPDLAAKANAKLATAHGPMSVGEHLPPEAAERIRAESGNGSAPGGEQAGQPGTGGHGTRTRSTASLLRAVEVVLRRYVVFPSAHEVTAVALWVLHTYTFEASETTPYLSLSSAAKRCGKSRLMEVLTLLVARAWYVTEPSEATLFRKVAASKPTLLVDEIDATFGKDSSATEGLRAIYNAGYRAGAVVPRCVGPSHEVKDFPVYCPKAFAGIKALPDTVADRSIPVVLQRRARGERKPRRFRLREAKADLAPLVGALKRWGKAHVETLAEARPDLPEALSDRAQDGWEPLLAIADLAGARWAKRAREAAVALHGVTEDADLGVTLLTHCRDAFEQSEAVEDGKLATGALLAHLVNRGDDSPWARWWADDLTAGRSKGPASRLANLVKPFGITPGELWVQGKTRGYKLADFEPAWERYCPRPPTNVPPPPTDPLNGRTVDRRSETLFEGSPRKPKTPLTRTLPSYRLAPR